MEKKEMIKKGLLVLIIVIVVIVLAVILFKKPNKDNNEDPKKENKTPLITSSIFTFDIIKAINEDNRENYLISPYNIELALSMLREGSDGNTKAEIDKVIGNRDIQDISVPKIINVANGVFIKNIYKSNVKQSFMDTMKNKYQSEVLYDEYKTPEVINNWAKEKTNGMIENLLDKMDENFIMGLASALAIDVKWASDFDCESTISEEFTKLDNSKMNAEMMHQIYKYDAKYIKTIDAEGIVIPYRKEENSKVELEFIALLPNTNVHDYIKSLNNDKLTDIFNNTKDASDKYRIKLSLPRFTYAYSVDELNKPLNTLGIKDAFNPMTANFKRMVDVDAYVGTAIHKTYIELTETGTKAAAITFFGVDASSMPMKEEYELIDIKFNKPFLYMIRERNTGEMLFFGTVYEPNEWKGTTCVDE